MGWGFLVGASGEREVAPGGEEGEERVGEGRWMAHWQCERGGARGTRAVWHAVAGVWWGHMSDGVACCGGARGKGDDVLARKIRVFLSFFSHSVCFKL